MVKKILVVDDDINIRILISAALENDPRYQLLEAASGEEGLELARRERPDLVLLDNILPGRDGFSVCRELKGDPETCLIRVMMLTAMAQEVDRRRGMAAGADAFFTKPFSPQDLLRKVEELLSE
jgi:DNA-binding response OmpR family regulator